MSRVGKSPVAVPSGVNVEINNSVVKVSGAKGNLEVKLPELVSVQIEDSVINVKNIDESKSSRTNQGLTRALINNMVEGVAKGFSKKLEVQGVGYKVNVSGQTLKMALGFSHEVVYSVPSDLAISNDGNTITIEGADKQRVGQVAAEIRALRKPEPYKGKGIRYTDEHILRKAGKAAGSGD